MNVLIARGKEECPSWTDVAVVIDVLRGATTACALLERGKRDVLLFADAQKADSFLAHHADFETFSDEPLSAAFSDNSPYLASKSVARQPGLLLASAGCKAAWDVRRAGVVLLGGFCNFYALAETLTSQTKDVLLIPAALFGPGNEEEDLLCAEALKDFIQGVGTPERALGEFGNTMRLKEFHASGPKTAEKDSRLAFKINGLPVVPQVTFAEDGAFAVCHPYGSPAHWLEAVKPASAQVPQEAAPAQTTQSAPLPETSAAVQAEPAAVQKETPAADPAPAEGKTSSLKSLFGGLAKSVKEEAHAIKEKAAAAAEDPKAAEAKSKLKSFFSDIVRSVKEEKKELEESLFQGAPQSASQERSYALNSDDPFDALMKQSAPEQKDVSVKPAPEQTSAEKSMPEQKPVDNPAQPVVEKETNTASSPVQPREESAPAEAVVLPGEVTFSGKAAGFEDAKKKKKAIVLFSGGLDSTTCLYWAIEHGYECEALTVSYGQRHDREVLAAQMIARNLGVKHHLITLNLPWLVSSSLVDRNQQIPDVALEDIPKEGIPSTYVPGRNLMFLSIAGSLLDAIGADAIIAGPNAIDFSGYPDCTPAFFKAAADALNRGTKMGVTEGIEVLAPLMRMSKTQIVQLAAKLKVPFELTWSCYAGGQKPCGHCDSCKLRAKGFAEAGVRDTSLD